MRFPARFAAAAVLAIGAISPGVAFAADVASGKKLASRWCAECHITTANGAAARSSEAPAFVSLAADPKWTEDALRTFLASPHPPMPKLDLSRFDIADLAAYILSLKPK